MSDVLDTPDADGEPQEQEFTEEELNPQPDNPEPEKECPYGKVIYVKGDVDLTGEQIQACRDADIVIEDQTTAIIVKDRNGLPGVMASPELIDYAEVIE